MPRIPVKDLREIAEKHGGEFAVLVLYNKEDNLTHVVTWGNTAHSCDRAAQLGEHLKKAMGWPERLWSTIPSRVSKLHRLIGDVVREAEEAGIGEQFIAKWGKFKRDLQEKVGRVMNPASEVQQDS